MNIQLNVSKEVLRSLSCRDAFMTECSNCAAFPNVQYVFKRYKKNKTKKPKKKQTDIVKLFNSLEEYIRKSVLISRLFETVFRRRFFKI